MPFADDGNRVRIVGDGVAVRESIPVGVYAVEQTNQGELVLTRTNFKTSVTMTGRMGAKRDKVLNAFSRRGSLGVLLSGEPGMGKTMFAQSMAGAALERGMPVIRVDADLDGLLSLISRIEQPVMLLFDEVDKTFGDSSDKDKGAVGQSLLSILDAKSGGLRLSVLTCNNPRWLNSYLLNRTGRLYYHFRFSPLCGEQLIEYLKYLGLPESSKEFQQLLVFSVFSSLNYDTVGVIVSELKAGYSLQESIEDLNVELGGADFNSSPDEGPSMDVYVEVVTDAGEVFVSTNYNNTLYLDSGALVAREFYRKSAYDPQTWSTSVLNISRSKMLVRGTWVELEPMDGDSWTLPIRFRNRYKDLAAQAADDDDTDVENVGKFSCRTHKVARVRVTGMARHFSATRRSIAMDSMCGMVPEEVMAETVPEQLGQPRPAPRGCVPRPRRR